MQSLKWIVAAGLAFGSAAAWGATAYTPGAGITGTPHDWSAPVSADGTSGGQSLLIWQAGTDAAKTSTYKGATYNTAWIDPATNKQGIKRVQFGLCTKCHTPHQAKSTNLLWNHTLPTATYSWDQPATTAGTTYPTFKGDTYKGGTTKCLSCHDGSLASTDGVWFNRQMVYGNKYVAAPGSQDSGHEVAHSTGNISGTHPVAMPYPFNGSTNTYNFVTTGAQIIATEFVGDPQGSGIRLYNDDGAGNVALGAIAGKSGMECSSCHDVHNGATVKDTILLRGKLAGGKADGYLCTKCHNK